MSIIHQLTDLFTSFPCLFIYISFAETKTNERIKTEQAHANLGQEKFTEAIVALSSALSLVPAPTATSASPSTSMNDRRWADIKELIGIAECEGGNVDKGRTHLSELVTLWGNSSNGEVGEGEGGKKTQGTKQYTRSPAPYLYLAQTATSGHEALMYYSSALTVLQDRLGDQVSRAKGQQEAMAVETHQAEAEEESEDEDEEDVRKDMVSALIAMIEIWMSDLW